MEQNSRWQKDTECEGWAGCSEKSSSTGTSLRTMWLRRSAAASTGREPLERHCLVPTTTNEHEVMADRWQACALPKGADGRLVGQPHSKPVLLGGAQEERRAGCPSPS